jgi:heme exporter protein B
MTRSGGFISKTVALAGKDLRIEFRGRSTLPPMLAFSLAVALLLAFTIPSSPAPLIDLTPPPGTVLLADLLAGFLWITVMFAGLIGFARTFELERRDGALDPLVLAPLDRSGLFLAKATANLVLIGVVEVMLLPVFALFFGLQLGARWPMMALVVVLVDLGFVAIGTLFAAIAAQTKSRELMLPILALPMMVPIFIAGVELTSDLFLGLEVGEIAGRGWFGLLVGYDVIFICLAMLAFEFAIE